MDHFNAMFEDKTTGTWWRQATGERSPARSRERVLAEIPSVQVTLAQWLALHPTSLIMQPDSTLRGKYSKSFDYETGTSRRSLTGTDTISWREKAWVVGIELNGKSKAFDWNRLRRERVINDEVGGTPIVLVLAGDGVSFYAFAGPIPRRDSRYGTIHSSRLACHTPWADLALPVASNACSRREFGHSWRTFHPGTETY